MAADDMINMLSDLPDEEMRQLTIPRGNCKRSSQNVPIFSFLWQGSCTYGQVVGDWGVHCNDGKLDQFFPLQIWSPPCLALQLIALEIPNLEDHSKYKYNPAFKSILGYLFHEDWCDLKKEVNSVFLVTNFGLILKGKPKSQHLKENVAYYFLSWGPLTSGVGSWNLKQSPRFCDCSHEADAGQLSCLPPWPGTRH